MSAPSATTRLPPLPRVSRRALRIAVLAPPWIPVPPPAYGGIEAVVALLCERLVARGHDVTLFAAPGSHSSAEVRPLLECPHPDTIGSALHESDHVSAAWDEVDLAAREGRPFDVVHDHSGFTALATASRAAAPVVHTLHGPFTRETACFYARHAHKAHLVAISRSQARLAPAGVRPSAVVPNPIVVEDWPLCFDKHDYLLWMGRMDPVKGADRAIAVARRCGHRLVLAGPVQPGQREYFAGAIEPHLDGEQISYVGEVGGERRTELFAHAKAFLMPIRWEEPFGMVMVEALACGTPVLAFPEGAASEIVIDGENGFHVLDEDHMADAVARLARIDPLRCRQSVAQRYHPDVVAKAYEAVYEQAIHAAALRGVRVAPAGRTARTATSRVAQRGGLAPGLRAVGKGRAAVALPAGARHDPAPKRSEVSHDHASW